MKKALVLSVLIISLGLAACGSFQATAATPTASVPADVVQTPVVPPVEPTTTPEIFNPLPADQRAFEAVRTLLAGQLSVDPLTIELVRVEPVDWPDSCLGLAGRDEMCAQVITPGYRITVRQSDMVFEFHTNRDASNIRQVK